MKENRIENVDFHKNYYLKSILCYFVPLAVLCSFFIYKYATGGFYSVGGYYMIHYLYTYKHGFVARGLVGEVISWFFDSVSDDVTKNTVIVFSLFLIFASALCIGKALQKSLKNPEAFNYVLLLLVVICILPFSFKIYITDIKLDKLLWAFTLLAVYLSDNKYSVWLVPVCCVIATLVNPIFLLCSMILISIILLQKFHSSKYSKKYAIICAVSYASMIAIGIFGVLAEKKLNFATPRELVDFYFARYSGGIEVAYETFDTEWLFDYFEPIGNIIKLAFKYYFKEWGNAQRCFMSFIFAALPTYTGLTLFWKRVIRLEENKFQRFIYFLCAISPIVMIPAVLISWEFSKYFGNNVLVQLCLIVYFIVNQHEAVCNTFKAFCDYCKNNVLIFAMGIAYYALICL